MPLNVCDPSFESFEKHVLPVLLKREYGVIAMKTMAGGFLDNKILPLGTFGKIFSAGAIPIIYSLVGLKVGSELSNILSNFQGVQKEEM